MPPPPTRSEPLVELLHGVAVSDPYRWLEDASSPEVRAWVDAQNAPTRAVLDGVPGRERIAERLDALLATGTLGTPAPVKGRYFFTRREGRQSQAVLFVREGLRGPERALLDPGALSPDGNVALDWWYPS